MLLEFLSFIFAKITFFTGSILNGESFPKPLSKEEETKYLLKMKEGSSEAREKLINHNLRLVAHVVKKYQGVAEADDLLSVGSIGLIKAIDSFSVEKGASLATYTARCIENEILMLIRQNKKHKNDVGLLDPMGTDGDGNDLTLMDLLFEKEDEVFMKVDKSIEREKFLEFLRKNLTKREYIVMCLRYGLKGGRNYAQREVAKMLKISRSYISRIEKKAIEKIKELVKRGKFYC